MDNVISIGKNKSVENEELYSENYSLLDRAVNYEIKTLERIEKVYDNKSHDKEISKLIYKENINLVLPLSLAILCITLFTSMILMKNVYFIFPSIVIAGLSVFLFSRYFNENNSKLNVFFRVYKEIERNEYLSMTEIVSLQKLISKDNMLDIIRDHEMKIPMKTALSALRVHFLGFKEYKAIKQYKYIEQKDKDEKKHSHYHSPIILD